MRPYLLVLCFYALSIIFAVGQPKLVELPFSVVDGYGPFRPNYNNIRWNDPTAKSDWSGSQRALGGVPANWKQVKQGEIISDNYQFIYQNVISSKLSQKLYRELQESWGWTPDTNTLSAKPIKCSVQIATGVDANGKTWLLLDTNNNGDFADEKPFEAPFMNIMDVSNGKINVPVFHRVRFEKVQKGLVVPVQANLNLFQTGDGLMYDYPQFGVASLRSFNSAKWLILRDNRGLMDPTFVSADIAVMDDTSNTRRRVRTNMSKSGEYITINQTTYKYQGVDLQRQVVHLQPVDPSDSLYSTQIGYKAHPLTAPEFTTGKSLSLSDYRGKYVLIDFWGTWCAPCVGEMKHLKEVYAQTKRDDFEIIGVVCNDTPERLRPFLDKQAITWPQVIANSSNKLTETFQVFGFPTTFLIDPQGKVLLTGLRGSQTVNFIKDLLSHRR